MPEEGNSHPFNDNLYFVKLDDASRGCLVKYSRVMEIGIDTIINRIVEERRKVAMEIEKYEKGLFTRETGMNIMDSDREIPVEDVMIEVPP